DLSPLAWIAALFAVVHVAVSVAAALLLDAALDFDPRQLGPAYVWAVPAGVCAVARWSRDATWTERQRTWLVAAPGGFAVAQAVTPGPWLLNVHRNGQGYTRTVWRESDMMARLERVPAGAVIYSNATAAIDLLSGRAVERLPERTQPLTAEPNPRYELELEHM